MKKHLKTNKAIKKLSAILSIIFIVSALPMFSVSADTVCTAKIGNAYYPSISAAIQNAKDGDTITPAAADTVITCGEKAELKASITIDGFTFGNGGFIAIAGNHDLTLKNCTFSAQSPYTETEVMTPAALSVNGKLTFTDNDFSRASDKAYFNNLETGSNAVYQLKDGSLISGNKFGSVQNNAVSIYAAADNAAITISNNTFMKSSAAVRLGNKRFTEVKAAFNFISNTDANSTEFVILKDEGTASREIFTGYKLSFVDLKTGENGSTALSNTPPKYTVSSLIGINPSGNMPQAEFAALPAASASAVPTPDGSEAPVAADATPSTEPTQAPSASPEPQSTDAPDTAATAAPTDVPEADVTPTAEPETTAVPAASEAPEASATPETSATPEASAAPEVTASPEATASPDSETTPAPQFTVSITAPETVEKISLINKETKAVTDCVKDESGNEIKFTASVQSGEYDIFASASAEYEIDLVKSDTEITVNNDNAAAELFVTEANDISGIEILTPPEKLFYKHGETFDPSGLSVNVFKTDGSTDTVIYGEDTGELFAFKPSLDTQLPVIDLYSGDREVTIIYGNKSADIELEYIMNSAAVTVLAPQPNVIAEFDAELPGGAYYTSSEVSWSPAIYPGSAYNYGTTYTAGVTLTANDGYYFSTDTEAPFTVSVNGDTAEVSSVSNDGKTAVISYTFARTWLPGGSIGNSDFSTGGRPTPTPKPGLNTYDHFAYMVGYPDGYIRPESNITRDEVATIFFRLLTDDSRAKYWSRVNYYIDVPSELWSNNAISTLTKAGILDGDGTAYFRPTDYITRAEFAKIAASFSDIVYSSTGAFGDVGGHWSENYINIAAEEGWIQGYEDGTFKPDQLITRAEAMTLVNNVLERHVQTGGLLRGMKTWIDNRDTNEWYYTAVQEATNSHDYTRPSNSRYETWTAVGANPDWTKLEQQWSSAASAGEIN